MERIIWTLWWQGIENAPSTVKKCIESMRRHANGAEVIVLNQDSVRNYIDLHDRVYTLLRERKITITHLSDLIRLKLLSKYGGLWIDSTIYVSEDIPEDIFMREFYTIKKGVGGDCKNIAKERWTVFLLGGEKKSPVFLEITKIFEKFWMINDEAVAYFWFDFCINEVYEKNSEIKRIMDNVPEYKGNVFEMAHRVRDISDISDENAGGIFNKLNWKIEGVNTRIRRIKSFGKHVKKMCSFRRIKKWGWKIVLITFLHDCTRTYTGYLGCRVSEVYNKVISDYCSSFVKKYIH